MANIFEVNSAIEEVIASNGNEKAAAVVVIKHALTLPDTRVLKDQHVSGGKKKGGMLSGFTSEMGNVTLKEDDQREERKEWFADQKARVGHYRLWRAGNNLFFHHYWASDLTTQGIFDANAPETYVLFYNPEALELNWFAKIVHGEWQRTGLLTRTRQIFLVLLDREHEGEQRPFGKHRIRGISADDAEKFKRFIATPEGKRKALIYGFLISTILGCALGALLILLFP